MGIVFLVVKGRELTKVLPTSVARARAVIKDFMMVDCGTTFRCDVELVRSGSLVDILDDGVGRRGKACLYRYRGSEERI